MYIYRIFNAKTLFNLKPIYVRSLVVRNSANVPSVDVNTNVIKDVILFKYENPRFFKMFNIFAICQFGFWSYLSIFAFQSLRDAPVSQDQNTSWWRKINLGENKYRNTLAASAFIIGMTINNL